MKEVLRKLKELFKRTKPKKKVISVPEEWVEKQPKKMARLRSQKSSIFLKVKRVIAGVLLLSNFVMAELFIWATQHNAQALAIFFFFNFIVLLDYLLITRHAS